MTNRVNGGLINQDGQDWERNSFERKFKVFLCPCDKHCYHPHEKRDERDTRARGDVRTNDDNFRPISVEMFSQIQGAR